MWGIWVRGPERKKTKVILRTGRTSPAIKNLSTIRIEKARRQKNDGSGIIGIQNCN